MKNTTSPIEIIKKSIQLFTVKENLLYFLKVYLILVPFSIFFTFQGIWVHPDLLQSGNTGLIILVAVINVAYVLSSIFVDAAAIEAVRRVFFKEKLEIKSTFSVGLKKYWKFALLSFILVLLTGLGLVLLIVPGIIFLVWFSFSRFLFIENKVGIKESLIKSKEIVKGRFWKITGRLFVFWVFSILLGQIVEIIPYGVGSVLDVLLGALFILPYYLLFKELSQKTSV